jgi:hypothetical protein
MVKEAIESKGAPVFDWVKISKVGKLGWDGDGSLLSGLTVEDLYLVSVSS